MLYTNRDLQLNNLNAISRLLENANYLNEQECIYRPEMVPIRENSRIQRDIIRLEDFVDFALANGITEGGYALAQICEASGVSQDNIVFSVDEVSVLEDFEMEDTVRKLLEAGQEVYACPVSSNDISYILAESVVNAADACLDNDNEDYCDYLLEAYINDKFDILLSEQYIVEGVLDKIKDTVGSGIDSIKDKAGKARDFIADKAGNVKDHIFAAGRKIKGYGSDAYDKVGELKDKLSTSAGNAKNWTARKISSLKTIAREKYNSGKKGLETFKNKAADFGGNIKGRVSNAYGYAANKIGQGRDYIKDKAGKIKDKIGDGIDYLSEKLRRKKVNEAALFENEGLSAVPSNSGKCSGSSCGKGFGDFVSDTWNTAKRKISSAYDTAMHSNNQEAKKAAKGNGPYGGFLSSFGYGKENGSSSTGNQASMGNTLPSS